LESNLSIDPTKYNILSKGCNLVCASYQDCFKQYFHLEESKLKKKGDKKSNLKVLIDPPTLPNTLITHSPKIHVEEFLCYIASIISVWFGFSLIMLTDVCLLIIKNANNFFYKYKTQITLTQFKINNNNDFGLKQMQNPRFTVR